MGIRDWRARRAMADPVRGEFRVSGSYRRPHEADSNLNEMLTGVLVADGIPPTPAEHMDHRVLGITTRVLPVLVDRADPSRFTVLWDEVAQPDQRAEARRQAQSDAKRMVGGGQPAQGPAAPGEPQVSVVAPADLPPWLGKAVAAALAGDDGDGGAAHVEVHYGDPTGSTDASGNLQAIGHPVHAVLLAVTDVPVPPYALPGPTASLTDLTLQVPRPDGTTYTAQTRMGFRSAERRAKLAVIGTRVPVRVDPADETHLAVDIPAWG